MNTVQISLTHPILFVMDFDNSAVVIPDYGSGSTTAASPTCVSVKAIADVDGDVRVSLSAAKDIVDKGSLKRVFVGPIETPSKRIAVVTSENRPILQLTVDTERTTVAIEVDDETHPQEIRVTAVLGSAS